jgi:aldehyde:ferredoxin oxidoreductase
VFTTFAWGLPDIQAQIQAACEGDFSLERLQEIGERIWNLERRFNMDAGITADQDTLPKRLLKDAAKTGPAAGKVAELDKMLPQYYELRGWGKDGVPTQETMTRLGV